MIYRLRHLNISHNALRNLTKAHFRGNREIEVIDLSSNGLEHIPEETFMDISKLTWLSLASNKKLTIPDSEPFLKNDNLQVLHLEDCGLYRISFSSFNGLSNLTELYLSYNKLTTVQIGAGTLGCPALKIRYLELSHNNLQEVPRNLAELQSLEDLGMRHNKLRNLSDIVHVERHVKRLNVSNNKWECLCKNCSLDRICGSISCQVDVCESPSEINLVRCFTEDTNTVVTEPLMRYDVSVTEPHAPQQNAMNMRRQLLFVTSCLLVALCIVLTLVNVYLHAKMRKIKRMTSRNMDPEQSLPLTVAVSQS
jgi:hypothetical protein